MPECHVVITVNTIAPKVSGIQPPSTIFSRLAAKKAKSTARKTPRRGQFALEPTSLLHVVDVFQSYPGRVVRDSYKHPRRRRAFRSIRAVKTDRPFSRGTSGSNPCTLESGCWLVGIVVVGRSYGGLGARRSCDLGGTGGPFPCEVSDRRLHTEAIRQLAGFTLTTTRLRSTTF
jgi:hypothetical protein